MNWSSIKCFVLFPVCICYHFFLEISNPCTCNAFLCNCAIILTLQLFKFSSMEAKVAHAVNHLGLVANGWLAEGDTYHLLRPCVFVLILESDRPAGTWCWLPLTGFDSGEPFFHRLYHWLSNLGFPCVSGTQFWCPHTSAQPNTLVEKKTFSGTLIVLHNLKYYEWNFKAMLVCAIGHGRNNYTL